MSFLTSIPVVEKSLKKNRIKFAISSFQATSILNELKIAKFPNFDSIPKLKVVGLKANNKTFNITPYVRIIVYMKTFYLLLCKC